MQIGWIYDISKISLKVDSRFSTDFGFKHIQKIV